MAVGEILRIDRAPSMPDLVAGRIRDMIASGALEPGDCIPPRPRWPDRWR